MNRQHPANAGISYPFIYMVIWVEVYDADDNLIKAYETDLADSQKRRTFAEQASEAYAAGQQLYTRPIRVQRRIS